MLLFVACVTATVSWGRSMSAGIAMPGGWALSMTWMRMPGQTWPSAATSFLAMWVVMMVAMMLPAVAPQLARYRRAGLTALAGAGYFAVWVAFGAVAYPVGVTLAAAALRWPAVARTVPLATGGVLVLAGLLQLTAWKQFHLQCCRDCPPSQPAGARTAWTHGLAVARHCVLCCSGYMALLLATGMMNLGVMTLVAGAITVERLAPRPERVARALGVVVLAAGALAMARALAA